MAQEGQINVDFTKLRSDIVDITAITEKADNASQQWLDEMDKNIKRNNRSSDAFTQEVFDAAKATDLLRKNSENLGDELQQLNKLQTQLTNRLIRYVSRGKDVKKVGESISKVKDRIKEVQAEQKKLGDQSDKSEKQQTAAFARIGQAVNRVTGLFKAFLALEIVQRGIEIARAFTQSVNESTKLRRSLAQLNVVSEKELPKITAQIQAIAQTSEQLSTVPVSFEEILLSANATSKQLEENFVTVLATIEDGLARGANANGEYLDSLREYGPFAKEAGISLGQLNEILIESTQRGVFSDKGIDAVKEATIRLREFTKTTQEALKGAFGEAFTEEIKLKVDSGDIFGAIQDISAALPQLEGQADKLGAVLADVFGGAGEDAGIAFLQILKDIDGELPVLTGEAAAAAERFRELNEANQEAAESSQRLSQSLTPIIEKLQTAAIRAKTFGINILNALIDIKDPGRQVQQTLDRLNISFNDLGVGGGKVLVDLQKRINEVNKELGDDPDAEGLFVALEKFRELQKSIGDLALSPDQLVAASTILTESRQEANAQLQTLIAQADAGESAAIEASKKRAKELTEAQRKEAEKREEERRKRANELFKIEQDLQKELEELQKEAQAAEIAALDDNSLAKIEATRDFLLAEIDAREEQLKEKTALLQVEKELTEQEAKTITDAEKQIRVDAAKETIELEQATADAILKLRQAVNVSILKQTEDFYKDLFDIINKGADDIEAEQEQDIQNIADGVTKRAEQFEKQLALEQSRITASEQFYNEQGELTQQGQDQLDALQTAFLDNQIAFYQNLTDAELEALQDTGVNVEALINELKKQRNEIGALSTETGAQDIFSLLGLDLSDEKKQAILAGFQLFTDEIKQIFTNLLDAEIAALDEQIATFDDSISTLEDRLAKEIELKEAQLPNNANIIQQELEQERAAQEQAIAQREAAVKRQEVLAKIERAAALTVAVANILKNFSAIPFVGVALGAAAIATLFTVFENSISKARSFKEGTPLFKSIGNQRNHEGKGELVFIHDNEAIIPADKNLKHQGLVSAIYNDDMDAIDKYVAGIPINIKGPSFAFDRTPAPMLDRGLPNLLMEGHRVKREYELVQQAKFTANIDNKKSEKLLSNIYEELKENNRIAKEANRKPRSKRPQIKSQGATKSMIAK